MTTGSGINKQVAYKVETTFGVAPAAAGAQLLRRVTSNLDMQKDTYQSNEIRQDQQVADFRHGVRRVAGSVSGELSPKTYADFMAAALKKDFVAGASSTGLSITIASVAGGYTLTRAAGSWLTDGFKLGDVGRLTAGGFNAANINKNVMVSGVTATVLTVFVLNATAMVAQGPITAATFAVTGKKSLIPQTGHTDKSFSLEHWFPDVPADEVFVGCKVSKVALALPPTGMATCAVEFMGKDVIPGTTQYFTNPAPLTATGTLAAVNGVLVVGGLVVANVTGLTLDIAAAQSGEPVVGSNTIPFLAAGRVIVTGQLTATFDTVTYRDAFINEAEIALFAVFTSDNSAGADFVGIQIPRLKFGGATKDDGEKTLVITLPFQALLNVAGGPTAATDLTTISIQDSAA